MTTLPSTLPDHDFAGAKRRYVEFYAEATVQNRYLKVTVLLLSCVIVGLVALNIRTQNSVRNFKPLVIRIDGTGRPQADNYTDLEYHAQAPELRFFLADFVTKHYGRMRATFKDNFARSLYFLDSSLAEAAMEANRNSANFEAFLNGSGEESDIEVTNVILEDLRKPPYRATVDFQKQFYGPGHRALRRERYTANVVFAFQDQVPNEQIPVNPLGFTISYLHEDQAFR